MGKLEYDHVVVGAGVSGMTAALLMGLQGRRTLLVEKARDIGGSIARFRCQGVPFDTGFHFTGGLEPGGLMSEMLHILGIHEAIHPHPVRQSEHNRFVFEPDGQAYVFPPERKCLIAQLKRDFPGEHEGIDAFFTRIDTVCAQTVNMDIRQVSNSPEILDDDYVSLQSVLNDLLKNRHLKALLAAYCMCYGASPTEVSFAGHARMTQALYKELVCVERGGEAFVDAFRTALADAGVDVLCNVGVTGVDGISERQVDALLLDNGDRVALKTGLFTIHPWDVLRILPRDRVSKAFCSRVESFEPSCGFFAVYGVCDDPGAIEDCMITLLPHDDLNGMFDAGHRNADSALFMISGIEECDDGPKRVITAFETACVSDLAEWSASSIKHRPAGYMAYKQQKTARICERLSEALPGLKGNLRVLDSASPLTFRDYLHSPDGSAYGVKQKLGQFNLFGRLPLRNLFVAGQSSLLPGVMGAMMSSFVGVRALVHKQEFSDFIERRLDH